MMNTMVIRTFCLAALLAAQPVLAGGPAAKGAYQPKTTLESNGECPAGTHAWVDSQGRPTCERLDALRPTYVGAAGCPDGTHETVDAWGDRHCKLR